MIRKQGVAMLELDAMNGLAAQVAALTTQFNIFLKNQQGAPVITCGLSQDNHHTDQCSQLTEPVNFVRNFQKQRVQ